MFRDVLSLGGVLIQLYTFYFYKKVFYKKMWRQRGGGNKRYFLYEHSFSRHNKNLKVDAYFVVDFISAYRAFTLMGTIS